MSDITPVKSKQDVTRWTEQYNDGVYSAVGSAGKSMLRGTFAIATTGFGKGLLAVAALALIAFPLGMGLLTAAEVVFVKGAVVSPVATAVAAGAYAGLEFFTTSVGLLTAAIGGTLGAVWETKKEYTKLTAAQAEEQARFYEMQRSRSLQQQVEVERAPEIIQPKVIEASPAPKQLEAAPEPKLLEAAPVETPSVVKKIIEERCPAAEPANYCKRESKRRADMVFTADKETGIGG